MLSIALELFFAVANMDSCDAFDEELRCRPAVLMHPVMRAEFKHPEVCVITERNALEVIVCDGALDSMYNPRTDTYIYQRIK